MASKITPSVEHSGEMESEITSRIGFLRFKSRTAFTQVVEEKIVINKFSECSQGNCDAVRSSTATFNTTACALKVYPNGNCEENEGYVSVEFVKYSEDPELHVLLKCLVSIVDNEGNERFFQTFTHESTGEHPVFGIDRFIKRSTLLERSDEFLWEDNLIMQFEISYTVKSGDPSSIWERNDTDGTVPIRIIDDESVRKIYLDIETAEGKIYKLPLKATNIQKNYICQKSRVFSRMLHTAMLEKSNMKVHIPDMNHTTLLNFLSYVNSESFMTNSLQETVDLYIAADKYEVMGLKRECTNDLYRNMTAENVCTILILADMHDDINLRNTAIAFINANRDKVIETESYSGLVEKPHLLQEIETAGTSSEIDDDDNKISSSEKNDDETLIFYS